MPKLHEPVLAALYKCIRDKEYRIYGWGKLTKGFGLKPNEFDTFHGCSRSIFYKTRNSLLHQKLIDTIKTDKTRRTEHKPRYAITILGIIKLFQTRPLVAKDFETIMMILLRQTYPYAKQLNTMSMWFHTTRQKPTKNMSLTYDQMFSIIDTKYLSEALTEAIHSLKIEESQDGVIVYLSYDFGNNNVLTSHKYISNNKKGIFHSYTFEGKWREQKIDMNTFLAFCADFIIGKVWFILSTKYEKYLPEQMRKSIYAPISVIEHMRHLTVDEAHFIAENLIPEQD